MNLIPESKQKNVSDLYQAALNGDKQARKVFTTFGRLLGEALQAFICSFEPEVIVFGGQISKSFDEFKLTFRQAIDNEDVKIDISNQALKSTFIGAYSLVK
ncbi:putative NBD/HSP70 family sugar kinase [Pullulanibacillus pueri]|uniref:ROK family protein n=1 Tax=Pullulanibacillus pueri TaxID=1437324 RepID=A0A8J2ZUQ1_9BACL|nr:putative NBD/HSP70 family sugar kinase [Pullulanibacillus pueri]GGH79809.1 hypothetical protein GCM10007096_15280 [Pullulanibacillus pueri]